MSKLKIKKNVLETNNIHILKDDRVMIDSDFDSLSEEEYSEIENDMVYIYYDIFDFEDDGGVKEWLDEYTFRVTNTDGTQRDTFTITDDGIEVGVAEYSD